MEYVFTQDNFDAEVLKADKPVMVDFFATWCGPCSRMAAPVEELAGEFDGKAKIGKLDIDVSMTVAQKYHVMSVPTFMFFKNGEIVGRIVGMVDKQELANKLNELL